MGIKGILPFVKKTHPELIRPIPARWLSPEIKGRTVAIDGPLLTSRFFFAAGGQELEEKRMVIGWHALITTMRKAGVTPITVWDVKGERPWKAKEHMRRNAGRQLALSRALHEDQRQIRLHKVEEVLKEAVRAEELPRIEEKLQDAPSTPVSEENQGSAGEATSDSQPSNLPRGEETSSTKNPGEKKSTAETDTWKGGIPTSPTGESSSTRIDEHGTEEQVEVQSPEPDRQPIIDTSSPHDQTQVGLGVVDSDVKDTEQDAAYTRILERVNDLIREVQSSSRPSSRRERAAPSASSETIDMETTDGDILREIGLETALTEDDTRSLTEEQDPTEEVEIKRALVEPATTYTESPRQMTLTAEEELRLYDLAEYLSLGEDIQSQLMKFGDDFGELRERARVVARTYERGRSIPSKWELQECQQLMHVMGVPVILAHPPFEAEGLASAMTLAGVADFVGTEDTDVLGYEAPLLRNIASNNKPIEIVEGKALRSDLGLSPEQYIDFLVLLGTDASSRIPGVGPVKALKLIQKFGTIEQILDNDEQLRERAGPDYQDEVDAARQMFTALPPLPSAEYLQAKEVDEQTISEFMRREHGVQLSTGRGGNAVAEREPQSQDRLAQDEALAYEAFLQQSDDLDFVE